MRDDAQGVLVLSNSAGAAQELQQDAIIIDPRDTIALADALAAALTMDAAEQHRRMARMRTIVRKANIYQWAGAMLNDATLLREEPAEEIAAAWAEAA